MEKIKVREETQSREIKREGEMRRRFLKVDGDSK